MKKLLLLLCLSTSNITYSQNQVADYVFYIQDTTLDNFVKEWLGVPYRYAGRTKYGIDCSQFTKRLYKDVYNKDLPNVSWKQWEATKRVTQDSLQKGDLVFFKSRRSPSGWHVGVYLGEGQFVHSPGRGDRVKISNLNNEYYRKTYKGAGRI